MRNETRMVRAVRAQLGEWPQLAGDGHLVERELLLLMAEGVDAARDAVANGSAALPLIRACKHLGDELAKAAPKVPADDGFDTALQFEF